MNKDAEWADKVEAQVTSGLLLLLGHPPAPVTATALAWSGFSCTPIRVASDMSLVNQEQMLADTTRAADQLRQELALHATRPDQAQQKAAVDGEGKAEAARLAKELESTRATNRDLTDALRAMEQGKERAEADLHRLRDVERELVALREQTQQDTTEAQVVSAQLDMMNQELLEKEPQLAALTLALNLTLIGRIN